MRLRKQAWNGLAPPTILAILVATIGFVALPAAAATLTAEAEYTFVVGDVDFDPGDRLVLDVGHTDALAPVLEDGDLRIMLKDDTRLHDPGIVYRDPADVIFHVRPGAEIEVPSNPSFGFLGDPGDPAWILPITQDPSLLWPGWSTEHASLAGEFPGFEFSMPDVQGPGDLFLWSTGSFGSITQIAGTGDGWPSDWSVSPGAHVHSNWGFTAEGTYTITFQVEGEWLNAPIETSLALTGLQNEYEAGDTATLTAVQDPETDLDDYRWFIRASGETEFTEIDGALEETYSFTVEEEHDNAEIKAVLYDENHNDIAESDPVTINVADDDPVVPVVLDEGHVDLFYPSYDGTDLTLQVNDDTGADAVLRDPSEVIIRGGPAAEYPVPDLAEYAFLGDPGDTVWRLPQLQDENLVWLGWNTEQLDLGVFDGDVVEFEIVSMEGPGEMFLYVEDFLGLPVVPFYFDTSDGLPDPWTENVSSHVHANWAFTEPGSYELEVRLSGSIDGTPVVSDTYTYTFELEESDPVETSLSITGLEEEYEAGDTAQLTAVQDPETELVHYHWFIRPAGETAFVVVENELDATYSFTVDETHDDAEIKAVLYDEDHNEVAESDPVTINVADEEPDPELSQVVTVSLDADQGALVVSVDPDDRHVVMSDFELSTQADSWQSTGELRPVTVTDTRSTAPGWNVSGQVSAFESGTASFSGSYLGWEPFVVSQADGQGVTPGNLVAPGFPTGDGLSVSSGLAAASAGSGIGTAVLSSDLMLTAPTTIQPGTYTALLTLTAI